LVTVSGRGSDFEMAELQRPGLFTSGSAGFASEAELGLGLGRNRMLRSPGAAIELDGDGFALQHNVDGMPVAVGEGDFFSQEVHVLALFGVSDDAEHITPHDEIEDVAALAGAVDGKAGEGRLALEPELKADIGLREGEAALLHGAVAAFTGLEGAQHAILHRPGAEPPMPVGGKRLHEGFLKRDRGLRAEGGAQAEEKGGEEFGSKGFHDGWFEE
jgi:hypothetical protein